MMVREGRSVISIYSHRPPKTFFQRSLPSHDISPSTNPYSSEKGVETLRTRRYLKFGVSKRVSNRSSKNLCIKGKQENRTETELLKLLTVLVAITETISECLSLPSYSLNFQRNKKKEVVHHSLLDMDEETNVERNVYL